MDGDDDVMSLEELALAFIHGGQQAQAQAQATSSTPVTKRDIDALFKKDPHEVGWATCKIAMDNHCAKLCGPDAAALLERLRSQLPD